MCISMWRASLSQAMGWGHKADGRHVMAYQVDAASSGGRANCVLLHVPTASLTEGNLGPGKDVPNLVKDLATSVPQLMRRKASRAPQDTKTFGGGGPIVVPYGAFELVIADSAGEIPGALSRVSPALQPDVNPKKMNFFDRARRTHSFILACFNNSVQKADHPIVVWYMPNDPTTVFVPGLEGHDDDTPVIGGKQPRNFTAIASVAGSTAGSRVHLTDPGIQGWGPKWTPRSVVGFSIEGDKEPNIDYNVPVSAIEAGVTGAELYDGLVAAA